MDLDDLFALRIYFQDQYEDENDIIKELKYELVNQGLSEEDANNKLKEFYNTYGIDIDINIFEEIEAPTDDFSENIFNNNPFLNLLQNNNAFANLLNNNAFNNLLNNNQGNNAFNNLLNNNQGNNAFTNLLTQLQQLQNNNPGNNSINNLLNQLQQLQNNNQENNNPVNNNPNDNQQIGTTPNSIFILLNQLYHQQNHINNEDDEGEGEDNEDEDNEDEDNEDENNEDNEDENNEDNEEDINNILPNIFVNPSQNEINNLAALLLAGFNIVPPPPQQDVVCTLDEEDKGKLSKYILTEDHTEKCNICLDGLVTDQEVIKLPCDHVYHSECILEWLDKYNYKCPCCRNEVGKAKYNV